MPFKNFLLAIIYIAFISLGLPDAILGAAWPVIQPAFNVPISWLGPVSLLISGATVLSSLFADRFCRKFGSGKVTAFSVFLTAGALIGFAFSRNYWMLCVFAIPYGLGAGGVDSCLNNYVAIHYSGKHMSWLHCMWGLGAAIGPYVMGAAIGFSNNWTLGYWSIGILQFVLCAFLFISLPVWKKSGNECEEQSSKPLTIKEIFLMPGAFAVIATFFCYCSLEQTAGQWAATYFFDHIGLKESTCALLASLYYVGITFGRFINGFLTIKFSDKTLVRCSIIMIILGLLIMLGPLGYVMKIVGMLIVGFGSAPIYPCVIHSTPRFFGEENSQAVIGVEMASAYLGICIMPPVFGFVADLFGLWILPIFLLAIALVMYVSHELAYKKVS